MSKKLSLNILTILLAINVLSVPLSQAMAETYNGSLSEMIQQQVGPRQETSQPKSTITAKGVTIQGKFYTNDEFIDIFLTGKRIENAPKYRIENNKIELLIQPRMAMALTGIYLIPGIGEVALAATGGIVIAGLLIVAGYNIYDFIVSYLKNPVNAISIKYGIPKGMLDAKGKVKMKDFNINVKGKNAKKNKEGWEIEKTKTNGGNGHKGDGWKLRNKKGNRVASLKPDGTVVGK